MARLAKQQEERERGADVRKEERVDRGGDVIPPDPDTALVELVDTRMRRGAFELEYGRYLRDSDIIEHPERADEDAGEEQSSRIDRCAEYVQVANGLVCQPGEI